MARFFNTAGPCRPKDHYMLPPERRLPALATLIDQKAYFVIHAPRQTGKTTLLRALAARLRSESRFAALHASCESGQAAGSDLDRGVQAVLDAIADEAEIQLAAELRPPSPQAFEVHRGEGRLRRYLRAWCERCPRPVVLFLDEIDSLLDATLLSVLRQLRDGYPSRPEHFPQSVALIGLRDVRDYRIHLRSDAHSLGTASPFNIKVESILLPNFTAEEVAELLQQHTAETGQPFTSEAKEQIWLLTRGQPWLVNALARQLIEAIVPDRHQPIEREHIERAKEQLILRRDTHLDSLVDRLREPRVRRVIEPILAGIFPAEEVLHDDLQLAQDLGLVVPGEAGLEIANPIYREVIPRALTRITESYLPVQRASYIAADGRLATDRLLVDFTAFWRQHAESFLERQPYSEAAAQLILMAWLQKIVNGGGATGRAAIEREYAVGSGRIDLQVHWPYAGGVQRWALELKRWRDGQPDPEAEGLEQLSRYLDRLGLESGTLVIFDTRGQAPPFAERGTQQLVTHGRYQITVLRL